MTNNIFFISYVTYTDLCGSTTNSLFRLVTHKSRTSTLSTIDLFLKLGLYTNVVFGIWMENFNIQSN